MRRLQHFWHRIIAAFAFRHPWAAGQLLDLLNGAGLAVREAGEAMNFSPKMAAKICQMGHP